MALSNVIHASQPIHVETIVTYYYADPDIGKSSLAFTAKNTILFDFDKGIHRVGALRRGTAVQVQRWTDVSNVTEEDLKPYDTVAFDTVGTMLDTVKAYYQSIQGNTQRDGNLTIKAQGYASSAFRDLISRIRGYGKDVIFIGHAEEQRNDDLLIHRPAMGGKNRDELYRISDIMAYLTYEKANDGQIVRVLKFKATNTHHAKNSGNLGATTGGNVVLPDLMNAPTFLNDLIDQAKKHLNTLTPAQIQTMKWLEERDQFFSECDQINFVNDLNNLIEQLDKTHPHYKEMRKYIKKHAEEILGYVFDREEKRYIDPKSQPFIGITEEQRDQILHFVHDYNLDVKTICEHFAIESLMGIESQHFDAVFQEINELQQEFTAKV